MLFSCKKDQKIPEVKNNADHNIKKDSVVTASNKTAVVFEFSNKDNTEIIKISASEVSDNDKFFLVGDKNSLIVSKYLKNKNNLKLVLSDTLFFDEFYYVNIYQKDFLRKRIQNTDYFLFALLESPKGNGDPEFNLNFIMLDTDNLKSYTLKYTGESTLRCDECIDGAFIKNELLELNPTLKKELYLFANKSKWIFNPSEEEKDINYYKNYEEKWYLDNTKSLFPDVIKSTYYTENLFEYTGQYDQDQISENANFKVVAYFRNNIIGYDKAKKLYFPIIVESCQTGCDKKIEFISKNEIMVSHEISSQRADTINLNEIKF